MQRLGSIFFKNFLRIVIAGQFHYIADKSFLLADEGSTLCRFDTGCISIEEQHYPGRVAFYYGRLGLGKGCPQRCHHVPLLATTFSMPAWCMAMTSI